jgi:hypothetical protein
MMLFHRMFIAEATLVGKLRHPRRRAAGRRHRRPRLPASSWNTSTARPEEHCAAGRLLPLQKVADVA